MGSEYDKLLDEIFKLQGRLQRAEAERKRLVEYGTRVEAERDALRADLEAAKIAIDVSIKKHNEEVLKGKQVITALLKERDALRDEKDALQNHIISIVDELEKGATAIREDKK